MPFRLARPNRFLYILSSAFLGVIAQAAAAAPSWQGTIPDVAQDPKKWHSLVEYMTEKDMPYGQIAAAYRMLTFFPDLPTKELAYKTIIGLIDRGYPFSTRSFFITGDIEPAPGNSFANSYNLYKGLISKDKGMDKWAEHYFTNVDKEHFPKYLFYTALDAYLKKDLDGAVKSLQKILAMDLGMDQEELVRKVARTLARIYYEMGKYDKSFDVYGSFLLKLNPVTPSDWLEAAWNLYYLKRYNEALGFLYNLESRNLGEASLEKYVIRALIYQGLCDTARMDSLLKSFDHDFGKPIFAIKSGEALSRLPELKNIFYQGNVEFHEATATLAELQKEIPLAEAMPAELQELGKYLYSSETTMLKRKVNSYTEQALTNVASYLINTSESLRFLKFDVSRQQFNPDSVFKESEPVAESRVENTVEAGMEIHWVQLGDYWRDERSEYKGILKDKCSK